MIYSSRFLYFIMFVLMTLHPFQTFAASGIVTVTSQPSGPVFASFGIAGTYTLSSDTTPTGFQVIGDRCGGIAQGDFFGYWDWIQWYGTFAELFYQVDGVSKGILGYAVWFNGANPTSDVGKEKTFSAYINIAGMMPGTSHTARVYYEDVAAYTCAARGGATMQRKYYNGTFVEQTVSFSIADPKVTLALRQLAINNIPNSLVFLSVFSVAATVT